MFKAKIKINYEFFQSIRGYFHLLTLILGIIVIAVGWHSYFNSEWTSIYEDVKSLLNGTTIYVAENGGSSIAFHLPNLLKEQIFLGVSLATFCISLMFYLIYGLGLQDRHQSSEGLWSILYNLLSAVALIVVGGLLILSAVKIDDFTVHLLQIPLFDEIVKPIESIQLYSEKISAGVICILNGGIFGVVAALSRHELKPKKKVRLFRRHTKNAPAS